MPEHRDCNLDRARSASSFRSRTLIALERRRRRFDDCLWLQWDFSRWLNGLGFV